MVDMNAHIDAAEKVRDATRDATATLINEAWNRVNSDAAPLQVEGALAEASHFRELWDKAERTLAAYRDAAEYHDDT